MEEKEVEQPNESDTSKLLPIDYNDRSTRSPLRSLRLGKPKVSPFAVLILVVFLVIYVLNQADRLVLPVLIPAGLRCTEAESSECAAANETNATNATSASEREQAASAPPTSPATPTISMQMQNVGNETTGTGCIEFTDFEQGLLTGPAFTVIYVVAGLPLSRLADTRSRPAVLAVGLCFWSCMVLLMGFANQFWQLLLLRVLLGIGEATCNPVAYSVIADVYPDEHRAFALSVYHYGVYLGGGFGWICGAINFALDWHWTFRLLGILGLATVPVALLVFWEPASVKKRREEQRKGKAVYSVMEVVCCLIKSLPFWLLLIASSVRNIPGYALGAWLPTFYALEHGASSEDYGIKVGLVVLFGGGIGCFLGGFISDRLSSRWRYSKALVIAVSQLLAAPCIVAVLLVPSLQGSYGALALAYVTAETWLGPAAAILQDICMPAMRAQASAVYIGVITLVASIGPVLVPAFFGIGSQFSKCTHGVGYSLLITVPTLYVASAVLFFLLALALHWRAPATQESKESTPEGSSPVPESSPVLANESEH